MICANAVHVRRIDARANIRQGGCAMIVYLAKIRSPLYADLWHGGTGQSLRRRAPGAVSLPLSGGPGYSEPDDPRLLRRRGSRSSGFLKRRSWQREADRRSGPGIQCCGAGGSGDDHGLGRRAAAGLRALSCSAPRTPHMKRPCQAFAGRWVVDDLMSAFRGRFCARFTCPLGCRFRRDGHVRPPLAGPGGGEAWACPRFLPGGRRAPASTAGPQGRRAQRDAQQP